MKIFDSVSNLFTFAARSTPGIVEEFDARSFPTQSFAADSVSSLNEQNTQFVKHKYKNNFPTQSFSAANVSSLKGVNEFL